MKRRIILLSSLALCSLCVQRAYGQSPTGAVVGRITDLTGAVLPGVSVSIANIDTGSARTVVSGNEGEFTATALPAGNYEVTARGPGFRRIVSDVTVETGLTVVVDLVMQLGSSSESITVSAAGPSLRYDSYQVSGVATRSEIDGLPLNGRDYLELAKLEPGALQPSRGSNNRTFVPLLSTPAGGNSGRGTLVTVDGGSVMQIGNGGSVMGFSQEAVQEFEVSTANFDLSTGMTASGSINVVTRSGTNTWHGSGFYFFRDHGLSAYPALKRDAFDPDPFFQRQQYGAAAGGPLRRDRLFLFATFERNDQRGVVSTELLTPQFAPLGRITASPVYVDQYSVRLDWHIDGRNSLFLRQSHEGGYSFAPTTVNGLGNLAYPSAWTQQPEWTDQSIAGWTSEPGTNWVSDLRFAYFFVSSGEQAPSQTNCANCLGIGAPAIDVIDSDLNIGTSTTTVVLARRFQLNELVSRQKGSHNLRFGADWETTRGGRTDTANQPVTMSLFSPQDVRNFNSIHPPNERLPLPSSLLTLQDILQLPLYDFTVGIGDPQVPQAGFGETRIAHLAHLFAQDTWRLRPQLTLDYGLGWSIDTPLNYDLNKPTYLAPLLGPGSLGPTHRNWKNFSPAVGFAWSPRAGGKTAIRGGAAVYYDFQTAFGISDNERVSLGPRGVGRGSYVSAGIPNPLTSVPGVPQGTLLQFFSPTSFTGESLLEALPAIRASLTALRGNPNNTDFSVTNIQVDKQGFVVDTRLPNASSTDVGLGIQRQLASDLVLSADLVYRRFRHISVSDPGAIDINHFSAARGPVLPLCSDSQRNDPSALCSLGPISLATAIGVGSYEGLLVRAQKHFARRWQLLASYTYSRTRGNNFGNGFDNDHPLSNYGPFNTDFPNILSVSGLVQLPAQFRLGIFATWVSRPPFSAFLGNLDLNGDGTTGDLLPGSTVNQFNRGFGKTDLQRLVNQFNATYAGTEDANGTLIPLITLPKLFDFGDPLITQDVRLSRNFSVSERLQVALMGEVFNLFNIANLSGYSGNLLSPAFGQPKSRFTQVFGSGGPRAFQFGARLYF